MAEYDLISKTALLKHLDMAIDCKDCPRNINRKTYYDRCACTEVGDICDTITDFATFADVQPVNQWISVKERQPDKDDLYLVAVENEICVYIDIADYSNNQWHKHDEVIYWQPLPELPKEG